MVGVVSTAISVNVESVAFTSSGCSHINHGTALGHLGLEQACPVALSVVGFRYKTNSVLVVAESLERVHDFLALCGIDTTTRNTIHHLLCLTHIAHKGSNGVGFSCGIATVGVLHVAPVKGGGW